MCSELLVKLLTIRTTMTTTFHPLLIFSQSRWLLMPFTPSTPSLVLLRLCSAFPGTILKNNRKGHVQLPHPARPEAEKVVKNNLKDEATLLCMYYLAVMGRSGAEEQTRI